MNTTNSDPHKCKILFIGVFDRTGKSTNTSQLLAFKKLGYNIVGYPYRQKAQQIGSQQRDEHLLKTVKENKFDLIIYSKCNGIPNKIVKEINAITTTCLWFMDPLVSYTPEMEERLALVDFACFDKINVLEKAKKISDNCFYVCEGYDSFTEKPYKDLKHEYDVGFVGNLYGNRQGILNAVSHQVTISNNVFGFNHPRLISQTKINLNICTDHGASDRIYKIMAANGFLLSDDWVGRKEHFVDGKDLIIYKDITDLNKKIKYYLSHDLERQQIANQGYETVQQFTRINWAQKIMEIYEQFR
jgi:spore maturation protein CgeB